MLWVDINFFISKKGQKKEQKVRFHLPVGSFSVIGFKRSGNQFKDLVTGFFLKFVFSIWVCQLIDYGKERLKK